MWWTEDGKRTLQGAERELFVRMADALWDDLEDELLDGECPSPTGIAVFDRLSVQQRFVILAEITAGLLDRKVPCVPLTQANEAAIAAVYQMGSEYLVDCFLHEDFRHLIRAAAKQHQLTDLPALRASNDEHGEVVNQLRDSVLWDADFAMEYVALDLPADRSQQVHQEMGIAPDYFTSLVSDPRNIEPHRKLLAKYLKPKRGSYLPMRQPKSSRRRREGA